jgi:protein-disulfide isomerase
MQIDTQGSARGIIRLALCVFFLALQVEGAQSQSRCKSNAKEVRSAVTAVSASNDDDALGRISMHVDIQGEPFRGAAMAPVVMIEYGDYECSFCGRFKRDVYPEIEERYIKSSLLKYLYRDLPIASHRYSLPAARGAYCAKEQGKYWEMHDGIFSLAQLSSADQISEQARAIGLRMRDFADCVDSDRSREEVQRVASRARMMQLVNTPTFLIGAHQPEEGSVNVMAIIVGVKSLVDLQAAIDPLIDQASSPDRCDDQPSGK